MTTRFTAYYRVSTAKQGASGLGLDAQRRAVEDHIKATGGTLVGSFEEVESGKLDNRPALADALAHCRLTGSRLIIAKLDRLSRNVRFLAALMEDGVDFVACDMPSATPFTVHIMAAVAEQERKAISARTKAALGEIKAALSVEGGTHTSRRSGKEIKRLGSPAGLAISRPDLGTAAVVARADAHASKVGPTAAALRAEGLSLAAIADRLTALHVQTPRGGSWTAMGVKRVLDRL